jgi:hypothetical protein
MKPKALMTPTLVQRSPGFVKTIPGTLSQTETVLQALKLETLTA